MQEPEYAWRSHVAKPNVLVGEPTVPVGEPMHVWRNHGTCGVAAEATAFFVSQEPRAPS